MKTIIRSIAFCVVTILVCACQEKKPEPAPAPVEPAKKEVYQPKHQSSTVDLKSIAKYEYVNAPFNEPAISVDVTYDPKVVYKRPIMIKYKYANGDSYTYTIPSEFGLWPNEAGKLRVITDDECTVWLQGQTKKGRFHELIFYGNPKYNGKKIKPNSYLNPPSGEIKYK